MSEDINYCESQSIYTEDGKYAVAATSPCHQPCADMEGMVNPSPERLEISLLCINELRDKYGLHKLEKAKKKSNPLGYRCSETECSGPLIDEPREKPKEALDAKWRMRLKEKALRLPKRKIQRSSETHEAA